MESTYKVCLNQLREANKDIEALHKTINITVAEVDKLKGHRQIVKDNIKLVDEVKALNIELISYKATVKELYKLVCDQKECIDKYKSLNVIA